MKLVWLSAVFTIIVTTICSAQSNSLVIRLRSMQPEADVFDNSVSEGSIGLNLGYGRVFKGNHLGVDVTAFGDLMNYKFYFGDDKRFDGSTIFTGLSFTPSYIVNPNSNVQFKLSLSVKGGYYFGLGTVYQYQIPQVNEERRIEDKSAGGIVGTALSPVISVQFPVDFGDVGIETGYDTSDYGAGIRRLRSAYYSPIKYKSGYLFIGAFFRLHN